MHDMICNIMHTPQCKVFSLHGKFTQKSRAAVFDTTTLRDVLPSEESGIWNLPVSGPRSTPCVIPSHSS